MAPHLRSPAQSCVGFLEYSLNVPALAEERNQGLRRNVRFILEAAELQYLLSDSGCFPPRELFFAVLTMSRVIVFACALDVP